MTTSKLNLCRHCTKSLRTLSATLRLPVIIPPIDPNPRPARSFFTKRLLSGRRKPVLQIPPPDPSSPPQPPFAQILRDPGLGLGNNGIPVMPSSPPLPGSQKKDYTDEKSWAETVFRTLSGGVKSDYLKCPFQPLSLLVFGWY